MEELTTTIPAGLNTVFEDYRQYKKRLDVEIRDNVEGFVRIGYLLKIARDTDILAESNYKTLAEFAQAEYGMTKDVVSRYVAVNDRYSQGGYSDQLEDRYKGFGIAKLAEMLTLSDEVIAEIGPSLTRREIQTIKKEIAEEEKVTPIEVAMEAAAPEAVKDDQQYSYTQRIWKEYLHENKDMYKQLDCEYYQVPFTDEDDRDKAVKILLETIAPNKEAILFSRIKGVGKIMISVDAEKKELTYTNTRTNEKIKVPATDVVIDIADIFRGTLDSLSWEMVYGEPFDSVVDMPEPEPVTIPEQAENEKTAAENEKTESPKTPKRQQDTEHKTQPAKAWMMEVTPEPEEKNAEVAPVQQEDRIRTIKTRELKNITDVHAGDKLINVDTGETADVLGWLLGDIKAATDHGIILVSAPSANGWAILEDDQENGEDYEEAERQQDTTPQADTGKMEKAIIDAKMEFEDVFSLAMDDGFTVEGLQSMYKSVADLKGKIDELLRYHLSHIGEEDKENDEPD